MATELLPNSFSSYKLTEEEEAQGSIYNDLQLKVLHNHLSKYAEQKIALDFDPNEPLKFAQAEATFKASIELLQYLIDSSEASLKTLTQLRTNQHNNEA